METAVPFSTLAGRGAAGTAAGALVTTLLDDVRRATGADVALVLQRVTRSGDYIVSASAGSEGLRGLRLRGGEAKTVDRFGTEDPRPRDLTDVPALARTLGAAAATAVGIAGTRRPACLLVTANARSAEAMAALHRVRVELGLALELDRLAREAEFHQRLRELFFAFSHSLSGLSIADALGGAARSVNTIFAARRTTVWLHDRGARHLTMAAASDGAIEAGAIPVGDAGAPAARGLRLDRPRMLVSPGEQTLIAPLRGWRRALGTLVIEGQFTAFDDGQVIEFAHELARQLAVGVENVQLIEQVLRQRERLAQSEKLASLGQFVAGIAHEMNNPLQGVLGHLELLIDTAPQARPLRAQLKRIYNDADRAAKIVRNLLVFTGARRMIRRRVSIDRILSRALASRAAAFDAGGIKVARKHGKVVPHVAGDPLLLQQAVLNVLINAEHAMAPVAPRHRRLEVVTRHDRSRKAVVITIRDTGGGIADHALPRIFDPFFTTKEVGQGTGLGLAITYGIIQEHGGSIHGANAAGGGAVFTIELPAAG
jgi:signal transduction histidine kinase